MDQIQQPQEEVEIRSKKYHRTSTAGELLAEDKELNPPLGYVWSEVPEWVREVIKRARVYPYVHKTESGKWIVGYSVSQIQMIKGVPHQQYVHQATGKGKIVPVGSIPLKPGSLADRSLWDVDSIHKWDYNGRDWEPDARTYELRANGEQWQEIHLLLKKLNVKWVDKTEERRQYNRSRRDQGK
jgi:hypothetical protein